MFRIQSEIKGSYILRIFFHKSKRDSILTELKAASPRQSGAIDRDVVDTQFTKQQIQEVLENVLVVKQDIQNKKVLLEQELKNAEVTNSNSYENLRNKRARREAENFRSASLEQWSRVKSYCQRLTKIAQSETVDATALIAEEWQKIEATRKEVYDLQQQAQNLLENAQQSLSMLETAKEQWEDFNL
jgi:hypothetical protein